MALAQPNCRRPICLAQIDGIVGSTALGRLIKYERRSVFREVRDARPTQPSKIPFFRLTRCQSNNRCGLLCACQHYFAVRRDVLHLEAKWCPQENPLFTCERDGVKCLCLAGLARGKPNFVATGWPCQTALVAPFF